MGAHWFHGRRMSEMENNSMDQDSESDTEHDIATILQYLVRSGQVRIFPPSPSLFDDGDSDEDACSSRSIPKVDQNPDTSQMQTSDLSHSIKLNSGVFNDAQFKTSTTIKTLPSIIKSREYGMNGRNRFSQGDRCQILKRVLPNKMQTLDTYQGKVFCGTFAKDGNVFMSAAQDYYIRIYDTSTGHFKLNKMVEARDVGWSILDTVVSPDGCNFVYCSWSECIHICNVSGDSEIHHALQLNPQERRFCVFALRFSQDGSEILGGANDECLYVYNLDVNKRTLRIRSHDDDVNTVAFADNTSQILFSGGDDGICKVWDRRTLCESHPKPVGLFAGHEDGITYVDSRGDNRHLITNSKDQTIKLWDMRAFSPPSSVEVSSRAVAFHNWDYRWQRVPPSLNRIKRKLAGDTSLMTYRGHSVLQTLIRCHFSPETSTSQSYIYTGCAQGRVVIYDVLTGKIKKILSGHKGCVRDVAWHPYQNEIVSSSWDGTIVKWSYSRMEQDSDPEEPLAVNTNRPITRSTTRAAAARLLYSGESHRARADTLRTNADTLRANVEGIRQGAVRDSLSQSANAEAARANAERMRQRVIRDSLARSSNAETVSTNADRVRQAAIRDAWSESANASLEVNAEMVRANAEIARANVEIARAHAEMLHATADIVHANAERNRQGVRNEWSQSEVFVRRSRRLREIRDRLLSSENPARTRSDSSNS